MQKNSTNLVLLVLVISLLFTPLIEVEAAYFTGYLDLDIKDKVNPDLSFYLKDNYRNKLFYTAKYESKPIVNRTKNYRDKYLDNSTLITNLSNEKEYFKANYKKYNLLYGRYNYQIKTPLLADYYNQYKGLKFTHRGKTNKLSIFLSRTAEVSITDKVFNPDYSVIFLSNRKIKRDSEKIYVNIMDEENRLIKIAVLRPEKDYTIDYLHGRVTFNPLIFFLNNPEHNYEVVANYKIEGNNRKYLNKGFNYSRQIFKNTKLHYYDLTEEETRYIRGAVLETKPTSNQKYSLEYQRLKERASNVNLSLNKGREYIKDPTTDKKEEKYGIRYKIKFRDNYLLKGQSQRTKFNSLQDNYTQGQNKISLTGKLNKRIKTDFSYMNLTNNINLKEYQYKAKIKSIITPDVKLNTTYLYNYDNLNQGKEVSLDNFFKLKFSENSYIYWGCLHNLTGKQTYSQYGVEFNIDNDNKISYKNKVLDTQYRRESFQYNYKTGFRVYQVIKKRLQTEQTIKKSQGLMYPLDRRSSLSVVRNVYSQKKINTENIIKYQLRLNKRFKTGINYLKYQLKDINQKRTGKRGFLKYTSRTGLAKLQYEEVTDRFNLYQKRRYRVLLEKEFKPHTLLYITINNNQISDQINKSAEFNKKSVFKLKHRPLNKNYKFIYRYSKENNKKSNNGILEQEINTQNSLKLLYKINQRFSLNTGIQRYQYQQNSREIRLENHISLNRIGISYKFLKNYNFKVEHRTFTQSSTGNKESGYLIALNKQVNDNFKLGLEYNFTDFNKLSKLALKEKGLSLNINYNW